MTIVEDRIYLEPVPPSKGFCIIDSPIKRDLITIQIVFLMLPLVILKMEASIHQHDVLSPQPTKEKEEIDW